MRAACRRRRVDAVSRRDGYPIAPASRFGDRLVLQRRQLLGRFAVNDTALAASPAARIARPIQSTADGPESLPEPVPVPGRLWAPDTPPAGVVTGVSGDVALVGVETGVVLVDGVVVVPADVVGVVDGVCAWVEPALQASPNVMSAAPRATPPAAARIDRLNFTLLASFAQIEVVMKH